jgi:hypothetical protein
MEVRAFQWEVQMNQELADFVLNVSEGVESCLINLGDFFSNLHPAYYWVFGPVLYIMIASRVSGAIYNQEIAALTPEKTASEVGCVFGIIWPITGVIALIQLLYNVSTIGMFKKKD